MDLQSDRILAQRKHNAGTRAGPVVWKPAEPAMARPPPRPPTLPGDSQKNSYLHPAAAPHPLPSPRRQQRQCRYQRPAPLPCLQREHKGVGDSQASLRSGLFCEQAASLPKQMPSPGPLNVFIIYFCGIDTMYLAVGFKERGNKERWKQLAFLTPKTTS